MQNLAWTFAAGAMAFVTAEWKVLSYFAIIAGLLLVLLGSSSQESSWVIDV